MPTLTNNRDPEVTVQEQGNLTLATESSTTVTSANLSWTVPTGKKWIVKALTSSITANATNRFVRLYNVGSADTNDITPFADLTTVTENWLLSNDLHVPAGWKIEVRSTSSANADHYAKIIYNEYDD